MAIQATNISVSTNANDPGGGSVVTFTRSDTGAQVQIPVSVSWATQTVPQDVQQIKSAIQAWLAQQNGLAAVNAAAVGIVL